jgi:hypothetical protein
MKPFASALIGITTLRKAWHFAFVLRDELLRRPVTQSRYAEIFTARTDPFGYAMSLSRPAVSSGFTASNARQTATVPGVWTASGEE